VQVDKDKVSFFSVLLNFYGNNGPGKIIKNGFFCNCNAGINWLGIRKSADNEE
jgi:hypothetical protein